MSTRTGSAQWQGGIKDGKGTVSTESGVLNSPYGFSTRFGDEKGTNPEELIGAAHAACFSMALSNMLSGAGIGNIDIKTTSKITLDPSQGAISKAHLVVVIRADADEETLVAAAKEAETGCPVSKLFKAEISMEARKG